MANDVGYGWDEPGESACANALSWLKVASGTSLNVRSLSELPVHYTGHWAQSIREFVCCNGPICRHCLDRIGQQRRFCLGVMDADRRVWAWEFGKLQADQLRGAVQSGAGLRGLELTICRPAGRNNPPALVLIGEQEATPADLPAEPDVLLLLQQQWQRQALRLGKAGTLASPVSSVKSSPLFPELPTGREAFRAAVAKAKGI